MPPPKVTNEEIDVNAMAFSSLDLAKEGMKGEHGVPVLVELVTAEGKERTPSDICCVVDVSGSMGTEAMLKQENGDQSGHGLSVLDVVKHALKTIIQTMGEHDRLALVAYSNDAQRIFELTEMTPAGRQACEAKLNDLNPNGMTNLWDGLKTAFDIFKASQGKDRLQHVMLFTDGLPNINPPRGIIPMLKRLKDKEGGRLPCTINTFGFGYELDSQLLSQLAIDGSGAYAFIPDAGFVGTVFVNAMSNLLVTMAKDTKLTLVAKNGAEFKSPVLGGHPQSSNASTIEVNLGSLQFGQAKSIVVFMKVPPAAAAADADYLEATLQYGTRAGGNPQSKPFKFKALAPDAGKVDMQYLRCRFVDQVRDCMNAVKQSPADKAAGKAIPMEKAVAIIKALQAEMSQKEKTVKGDEQLEESFSFLKEDIEGQVSEALSREDWYNKWGIHYLPSLMFAHLTQQCNNFKDAGVQNYGGTLFNKVRDDADEAFLKLPPPQPSVRPPPVVSQPSSGIFGGVARPVGSAPPPTVAISMAAFHDRYAG